MAAKAATKSSPKAATKTTTKTASKPATAKAAKTTLTPDPVATPSTTSTTTTTGRDAPYPIVDRNPWGILALVLGIVGLGGVGTIIAGVQDGRHKGRDITIGILQIVILFVGSVWGLVWGILIFVKGNK